MKKFAFLTVLSFVAGWAWAQRVTDIVDRGLVAIPSSASGNYVGWKVFAEEYYDVTYNLYRDGVKIASGLSVSNYNDTGGGASSSYQVAPVVNGVEQGRSSAVKRWANQYMDIATQPATDRDGNNVNSHYHLNDVTLADVNGDGVVEFIVKRPCDIAADITNKKAFHQLDCYDLKGNRLWWIDMGPNMLSGADEQWDCVGYDWDEDGKAEILLRGQDNMIIHHADGSVTNIGNMSTDTRWDGIEYTSTGNEYLLYLEGATGKPYQIGETAHPNYMTYPIARGNDSDWGSGISGHRSTKHFFGAPFLDGRHASIFIGRGIYTKIYCKAFDIDKTTHKLTQRWAWECTSSSSPWFGQGFHNYAIADVDWDGRDEIVYGSMVIDDNGKGLSTTGLGHGDAQHCGDLDPYRHGQEQFTCNESSPAMNYRNATTSTMYYRKVASGDDGRALCGNFTNSYPGSVGRSVGTGMISSVADKEISELGELIAWSDLNNRIYWDGDLCDEVLNSPGTEREAKIEKPGQGRIFTSSGCNMNNWSKNNPGAQADIFGDWREEIVLRCGNSLRIYTTPHYTKYRNYTLWHDHQYRQAMVWQTLGYNQPPHVSYFLGEMEGITIAPPPLTMTGRNEVRNGETVGASLNGKHAIVCETGNSEVTIEEGASPSVLTFNVPSWVQGSGRNNETAKQPKITYQYYTCNVLGGAIGGRTRLVKQGDGVLVLPTVTNTHSGNTDIWAGTVKFSGTMQNSRVWMNRFARLTGSGTYGKSVELDYASELSPGGDDEKGTVSIADTLILNFGSKVNFDLYPDLTSDCIKAGTLKIGTKSWKYGPEYLTPVFVVKNQGDGKLAEGQYKLMEAGKVVGNLSDIIIKGVSGQKVQLVNKDGGIYLEVSGIRDASVVYWKGNNGADWDYANTENFTDKDGFSDIFVENDKVVFGDDAQIFNVKLSGELPCDSIVVNNTKAYTFSGTGLISGKSVLVKTGEGKLTISTDNTYSGGNHIKGGTVVISSMANDTQKKGNLGAVVTSSALFTIENGATLQTTASVTNASPISLVGTGGGVINNSADFVMNKSFSGTLLTKKGNGWLKLYSNNTSLNKLAISGGTVDVNVATPAKAVSLEGGTLNLNVASSVSIDVAEGKTAVLNFNADRDTYSNKLTGSGTVTMYYPLVKGSGWYATRCQLTGNWSAFEGTININGVADDGRFCLNNSYGMPKGAMNIPSGYELQNSGKIYRIGKVTGAGSLGGSCTFSNNSSVGANTWQVGNDESNFTFDGKVVSNALFQKVGSCKMTTKGQWTTTGAVAVNGGELHLSGGSTLGTGTLTVGKDGLLSGVTSAGKSMTNSSVTVNGRLQVGTLATSLTGTMDFGGKSLTFKSGSRLQLGISKCATATSGGGCMIKNISTLTLDGVIELYAGNSTDLQVGDSIRLWDGVTTVKGTPTFEFPAGYEFDTSRLVTEGLLVVTMADGIRDIKTDETDGGSYYDVSGRRVDEAYKGVIIRNGKMYLKR